MNFAKLSLILDRISSEEALELVNLLIPLVEAVLDYSICQPRKYSTSVNNILRLKEGLSVLTEMGFRQENSKIYSVMFSAETVKNFNHLLDLLNKLQITLIAKNADKVSAIRDEAPADLLDNPFRLLAPASTVSPLTSKNKIKPIVLPRLEAEYTHSFFHRLELIFHNTLRYANKDLLDRARQLIPKAIISLGAQHRLRATQEKIRKGLTININYSIQDFLLLELLQWFKSDFFTWVDSPHCENCGNETQFSHISKDRRLYSDRVELHKCTFCHHFTPFARYSDLNILLETRRGRCGEWADVFTLFCLCMDWEARIVFDENDHVWTEVFSLAQNRWVHCDPCENICDQPLIYESGWKKKMTYVMAYSIEEVQDVTWRYSSNHAEVRKCRNKCDENELISVLLHLRNKRQRNFSPARKAYLTKRLAIELVELMIEKQPDDKDNKGRESGDISWRLARGELDSEEQQKQIIWQINLDEILGNSGQKISLEYSAAYDIYRFCVNDKIVEISEGWQSKVYKHHNMIRKEETDWKQVYLARRENDKPGRISWVINFAGPSRRKLTQIAIEFYAVTFQNGLIIAQILSDDICENIPSHLKMFTTDKFAGKTCITIEAVLSGGVGPEAWQHAQLFRQSLDASTYPFNVSFIFS